jgi:subtilisin family serine protease
MRRGKSRPKRPLLGNDLRRIQPKLRMVANGSTVVNSVRAELSAAVKLTTRRALDSIPRVRAADAVPVTRQEFAKTRKKRLPRRGKLASLAPDVEVNVFLHTTTPNELPQSLAKESGRKGRITKATVPLSAMRKIASDERVAYIELGEPLKAPNPIISAAKPAAPPMSRVDAGPASLHKNGAGVLIGIIDVEGFDFSHPDFLDATGATRWLSIWDQGGEARASPQKTGQFDYGAEFTGKVLNAAIKASKSIGLPAYELERQSQRVPESHGTHVASIAAGKRGVCPKAAIAGVLIDLPPEDSDRRRSFYDSTRLADAVDYLLALGEKHGLPVSINVSLGTNGHAHDTSSAINRWIDASLNVPGRCVTIAAGNAGQARADAPDDFGWLTGHIHTGGQIAKSALVRDLEWVVVGNGVLDISENELELWYGPQDRFAVQLRPPGMDWLEPVEPGSFIENRRLADGSFISIYNELYHPANGCNYISVYLSPLLSDQGIVGVRAGTWLVRVLGREVRDGTFHAWIERDDPRKIGPLGPKELWRFPSFFSDQSNIDNTSVSSLACGERVISVANLDEVRNRINVSSSQGPTRDGRFKPDVAASGTNVVAAKAFSGASDLWVSMTGTSMASPFVAGVAGLMLATQRSLTAAQIRGILLRTSKPLPGADYNWRNDAGFGVIDAKACVAEASRIHRPKDLTGQ